MPRFIPSGWSGACRHERRRSQLPVIRARPLSPRRSGRRTARGGAPQWPHTDQRRPEPERSISLQRERRPHDRRFCVETGIGRQPFRRYEFRRQFTVSSSRCPFSAAYLIVHFVAEPRANLFKVAFYCFRLLLQLSTVFRAIYIDAKFFNKNSSLIFIENIAIATMFL